MNLSDDERRKIDDLYEKSLPPARPPYIPEITVAEAVKLLNKIIHMPFAPQTAIGLEMTARAFTRIVGTKEKGEFLIETVVAGCPRFPTAVEMRWIYSRFYIPADGRPPYEVDMSDFMKMPGSSE